MPLKNRDESWNRVTLWLGLPQGWLFLYVQDGCLMASDWSIFTDLGRLYAKIHKNVKSWSFHRLVWIWPVSLVQTGFRTTNYKLFMVRKLNMSRKDIVSGKWMKLWISSSGLHFEALDGIVQQTSFHFHIDVSNWPIECFHHERQQRRRQYHHRLTLGHFNLPMFDSEAFCRNLYYIDYII